MAYIGKKPEDLIRGNASYNAFTGDGSTTTFDVTNLLPDGGSFDVEVFVDNVRQEAGSSKSYTIGQDGSGDLKRVTFNTAPDDGAEIYVINPGRETSIISVADNTITTAKLQDDAVTTAKITDSNVTTAKIAADAITGAKIADDAINSEHITDGSVDNVHLAGSIANAKLANSSITINGPAVSLGGSVTAGTDWQAVVVADGSTQLTATAGKGYFLDTNTGVIEVFLPASPSRGDTIFLADYGGNFATNNVLVNTGGQLIDSTATGGNAGIDYKLDTNNLVVELVYVDSSKGWQIIENEAKSGLSTAEDTNARYLEATGGTVTTSGNAKIHTFTGDSNFVVSSAGNDAGSNTVSYLVIAGGGAGGTCRSGGGGAGGYREGKTPQCVSYTASPLNAPAGLPVTAQTYPVTVGAGGTSPGNRVHHGGTGSNSVFSTITSAGGGGGASDGSPTTGENGGSAGGGANSGPGGTGNTPPVSPPQGNNGGNSIIGNAGGGGGGAGAVGGNMPSNPTAGTGGAGVTSCITGSPVARAGGGGGGSSGTGAPGGTGGGGNGKGGGQPTAAGCAGTANTGGGGGGVSEPGSGGGGAGGKGVVIIRYKFQG
jgi:hypothetical protein